MMNQQAMDSLYSATYVEDYLDCMENLPDDIQRNLSRMRDLDIQYSQYMKELNSAMQDLLDQIDEEQIEERSFPFPLNDPDSAVRRRRKFSKARTSVQETLMKAQDIGDEKLQIAQNVQDNVENKARQLELDKKNLEYGRENENEAAKEERERSNIKRARRVKHEVYVPSIMGPTSLEVTYSEPGQDDGKPTSGSRYTDHHEKSSTINDQHEPTSSTRKTSGASHQSNQASSSRGSERTSTKKNSNNHTNKDEDTPGPSGRASDRNGGSGGSTVHAGKQSQKGGANAATEKKANAGKKRKATKQNNKNKDTSPQDDPDAIDPDEPTYCLCDQISYGEMIGCDNDLCPIEWFHFSCVNLAHKPKGKWYCPRCRGDKPNVMKNRTVLIKELAKYNREREEKA